MGRTQTTGHSQFIRNRGAALNGDGRHALNDPSKDNKQSRDPIEAVLPTQVASALAALWRSEGRFFDRSARIKLTSEANHFLELHLWFGSVAAFFDGLFKKMCSRGREWQLGNLIKNFRSIRELLLNLHENGPN